MGLEAGQWLTIVGWPVTGFISLAVGWLLGRYNRPRRTLVWSVMNEAHLIDEASARSLRTPMRLLVGNETVDNVSVVRMRLGNNGNLEMRNATAEVMFPEGSLVHDARLVTNSTAFERKVQVAPSGGVVKVVFDHLNPGQEVDFEAIVTRAAENTRDFNDDHPRQHPLRRSMQGAYGDP